jgi:hypothetical protein
VLAIQTCLVLHCTLAEPETFAGLFLVCYVLSSSSSRMVGLVTKTLLVLVYDMRQLSCVTCSATTEDSLVLKQAAKLP